LPYVEPTPRKRSEDARPEARPAISVPAPAMSLVAPPLLAAFPR
jgi:hypothetical protein